MVIGIHMNEGLFLTKGGLRRSKKASCTATSMTSQAVGGFLKSGSPQSSNNSGFKRNTSMIFE